MTRAHQIAAHILPRADEIAHALGLDHGYRDAVKLTADQQPHEAVGIALIGLHAI